MRFILIILLLAASAIHAADNVKTGPGSPGQEKERSAAPDGNSGTMSDAELRYYRKARTVAGKYRFSSVMIKRSLLLKVRRDLSGEIRVTEEIFLRDQNAAAAFTYLKPQNGYVTGVQVFFSNGKTAKDIEKFKNKQIKTVRINGLEPGTLLRRNYVVLIARPQALPVFNADIPLQKNYPVLETLFSLQSEGLKVHARFYNVKAEKKPDNTVRVGLIPVYSPLPYDDRVQPHAARIHVSNVSSWDEINRLMLNAMKPSAVLDGKSRAILQKLTANRNTKTEKLRAVYDYLCRLRYLTEPVGIAAVRPRTPGTMFREKFGDCKDKANALILMARELGIEAYPVLLNRGGVFDQNFPSWQFNHMLVYIPKLESYTGGLWLDATDGVMPFGTLPSGDDGRTGLVMMSPDKYEFRKVSADRFENMITQTLKLKVETDGSARGTMEIRYSGLSGSSMRQELIGADMVRRDYKSRQLTDELCRGIELLNGSFTNGNRMEQPFIIRGTVAFEPGMFSMDRIGLPGKIDRYFLTPRRFFPIRLFSGAPLKVVQIVELEGAEFNPGSRQGKACGIEVSFKAEKKRRTAEIRVRKAIIPPADYPKVRRLIRDFESWLRTPSR